jgi:hypothetical protein
VTEDWIHSNIKEDSSLVPYLASSPHKDIISQMADKLMCSLLLRSQATGDEGDVLQIPGVAIGQGGTIGDA